MKKYSVIFLGANEMSRIKRQNKPPFSPIAVANQFLDLAAHDSISLDPMKLQKLVYFAHGWHLAIVGEKLITEPVEAWKWGPVIPFLYYNLRKYGMQVITEFLEVETLFSSFIPKIKECDENIKSLDVIRQTWDEYKNFSGIQLSNFTHIKESPWRNLYDKYGEHIPYHAKIIDNNAIRKYFENM